MSRCFSYDRSLKTYRYKFLILLPNYKGHITYFSVSGSKKWVILTASLHDLFIFF